MKILGLKLTHDSSFSIIKDSELICCIEFEKVNNNVRHCQFDINIKKLNAILKDYDYHIDDFDCIVIDGWHKEFVESSLFGKKNSELKVNDYGGVYIKNKFSLKCFNKDYHKYYSNTHLESHIWSAYCTSPFVEKGESSFILVWDGGMVPHLLYYNFENRKFQNFGGIFNIIGHVYHTFPNKFEPFLDYKQDDISVAGKVMAYIALGHVNLKLLKSFSNIYDLKNRKIPTKPKYREAIELATYELIDRFRNASIDKQSFLEKLNSADILHTFHLFINDLLITEVQKKIETIEGNYTPNLCYSGGSALNIKWNSALRESKIFDNIWVPPFPNDSGSSIGSACAGMIYTSSNHSLKWNVYLGPKLFNREELMMGWEKTGFSLNSLAILIMELDKPIIMINGRAEIGPRALGNRSILAQATSKEMKQHLNDIKSREFYRPIAPICLEEYAPRIFLPGTPDPYMLFEHKVKKDWISKVPAICHLDNSARLQTINSEQNEVIYKLLSAYHNISGVPLLCNTSANLKGKGFFPDIISAMQWGKVDFIWSDNTLYFKSIHNKVVNSFKLIDALSP